MARRFLYFGLRDDVLLALTAIESSHDVVYRPTSFHDTSAIPCFTTAADLPGLGTAHHGNRNDEACYLVTRAEQPHAIESAPFGEGRTKFWVNQYGNPESVYLTPGGLHSSGVIVAGECATDSVAAGSKRLYDALRRAFARHFSKVGECYVGPDAYEAALDGTRLVNNAGQPAARDVKVRPRSRKGRT